MQGCMNVTEATIGIATKNRPKMLSRLLTSILSQNDMKLDILIVDGSDTIDSINEFEVQQCIDVIKSTNTNVTVVSMKEPLVDSRNFILRESKKYCIFIDDDVILGSSVLNILYEYRAAAPFVSPLIKELKNYLEMPDYILDFEPNILPFDNYKTENPQKLRLFDTVCVLLNRDAALKAGGFCEYPFEGHHLSLRMSPGIVVPSVKAYHLPNPKEYRNEAHTSKTNGMLPLLSSLIERAKLY